jgi:hypothetical protein
MLFSKKNRQVEAAKIWHAVDRKNEAGVATVADIAGPTGLRIIRSESRRPAGGAS